MTNYINGAINEAIGKGKALMSKIPGARDLGQYFPLLATVAQREIDQLLRELDYIYTDPDYNNPTNIRNKYLLFKQISRKLSEIENVVIAAMSRKAAEDEFVNKLLLEICKEIDYPVQTPVASCLSQKYYHIYPQYNLICIPLLESEFVLHLADIYHELGHPLTSLENPKVEPFQNNLGYFNIEVKKYFDEEIRQIELAKGTDRKYDPIYVWKDCWLEKWSTELFCDLFATFTLGPAYAWSNLHMCAKMSWEVFKLPMLQVVDHPPGDARMQAILHGLDLIGFNSEKAAIQSKWDEFKSIIDEKEPPEFSIALPQKLIRRAAEFCLIGTKQIGCELAGKTVEPLQTPALKVNQLLNNSWDQFWKNPETFRKWERDTLDSFKKSL
jgi:hypothetical protein